VVYKTRKLRKKLEREISEVEKEIRWYINELAKVKEQRDEGSDVDALLVKLNKELEELQQLKRELLRRRDKSLSLF
jgi:tRNA uridine 5-carbamoylmethylation protein Kti12